MGEKNDRIKELEKQIEDLMHRWPAHSVKPAMVQRLDELEEELRKAQIERERREKDVFFAGHWQSPIPPKDRAGFGGLDYYPPDPDCRFEIELYEHEEKKMVRMAYTKGEECVLQAYKSDAEEEQLFISFSLPDTFGGETRFLIPILKSVR